MSSLREVKDRIASVRSTLKITSAMKLVASSKLLRAQRTIEALRPYEEALGRILSAVQGDSSLALRMTGPQGDSSLALRMTTDSTPSLLKEQSTPSLSFRPERSGAEESPGMTSSRVDSPAAPRILLAFASNASMCGAFNANAIKAALSEARALQAPLQAWVFGRKMAQALSKAGIPVARDFSQLVGKPDFDAVAAISAELRDLYASGGISGSTLVYNHFVSTGRQQVTVEPFLEQRKMQSSDNKEDTQNRPGGQARTILDKSLKDSDLHSTADYIFEPSQAELLASLRPQVLDLKLYAALLDSIASEHAARMIAMQTATDNAESLLSELTLEYNKGRQQKITAEILDLVAGEA
ncbi:MAG: F0F1 ATP synthase subunit gamma [Bacteroidales bacterium]|nr:F0F1 ATP synthase subunit gamma [Bacteroidales bacterium]